jgi:hypothetical protein
VLLYAVICGILQLILLKAVMLYTLYKWNSWEANTNVRITKDCTARDGGSCRLQNSIFSFHKSGIYKLAGLKKNKKVEVMAKDQSVGQML